ncbi:MULTISPECIES: polymorphic toxin type 34 domain-containing protein [unclassified Nocardia]|uniref:polymorphic toxin type 34 domain-containing protein n=1 Tax=unclassified Nocardia TaxID=2637762 RepID=UPI0033B8BD9A
MAGSYDKVARWASDYDNVSADLLGTCASLSNAMANFSNILNTAGNNWAYSNWKANTDPNKGEAPSTPFHIPQGMVFTEGIQPAPTSLGGNSQGLDTSIPGLISEIGFTVPNGDRDKLQTAEDAWRKFAESAAVKNIKSEIEKISSSFDSAQTKAPDLADVKAHFSTLANGGDALTTVAGSTYNAVGTHRTDLVAFRSDLDSKVNDLMLELLAIAAITVAVVVLTEILTVGIATLGPAEAEVAAGTAAGAAAVTSAAGRIKKLWEICRLFQTIEIGLGIAIATDAAHPLDIQSALDDLAALTAVTVAGAFVAAMAKGGRQNVGDTGILQEARDLMAREGLTEKQICEALAKMWDEAKGDSARRKRIYSTQKAKNCRHSSLSGDR